MLKSELRECKFSRKCDRRYKIKEIGQTATLVVLALAFSSSWLIPATISKIRENQSHREYQIQSPQTNNGFRDYLDLEQKLYEQGVEEMFKENAGNLHHI